MELWYPDAVRRDGPMEKTGYSGIPVRDGRGLVMHSMEGYMHSALDILDDVNIDSSWHFSNPKEGPLLQHYAIDVVAWHGTSRGANRRFGGCENEGMVGQPLTRSQINNNVGLMVWMAKNDVQPWPGFIRGDTLFEHKEMIWFGSPATACPSDRIPWEELIRMAETVQSLQLTVAIQRSQLEMAQAAARGDWQKVYDLSRFWLGK